MLICLLSRDFQFNFGFSFRENGTAILMMNLGGPETVDKVKPFLTRLFSDPDIFPVPFQQYLGPLMAKRRSPHVEKLYEEIGGSPIRKWTERQGELLAQSLDTRSPGTSPHHNLICFRYSDPLTEDTIKALKESGIKRVIAFTQYPQFSCTTTGSSLNELRRKLELYDCNDIDLSIIDRWGDHPSYAKAVAKKVKECLNTWSEDQRDDVMIFFSAHSIPIRVVDQGDTYPMEVASTVSRVMEELKVPNPHRLVWQSKVGPLPWLGPQIEDALKKCKTIGVKKVVVVPIAFTSDHIETLSEIDVTYGALAKELGLDMRRSESLNDDPVFIEALTDIVNDHIVSKERFNRQLGTRCIGCTNEECAKTRAQFSDRGCNKQ